MTTLNLAITTGDDDAQETSGTMLLTGTSNNANNVSQYIGLRFQNVTIPQGSTINTAVLSCYLVSTSYDSPDTTIYGDNADNSAAFTTTASDISNRTATTATVAYTASNIGTGYKDTPDLSAVIEEITDRGSWSSGNALTLIITGDSAGSVYRIRSYEGDSAQAPTLAIDYTAPAGGSHANRKTNRIPLTSHVGGLLA
jgi:hypothetical protein